MLVKVTDVVQLQQLGSTPGHIRKTLKKKIFFDVVSNVFIHRDDLNQVARSYFGRLCLNSFVRMQV